MKHLIDWNKIKKKIFKEKLLRDEIDIKESSYYFNLIIIIILIIGLMFLFQKYIEKKKENLNKDLPLL
jgi:hypothetical protein